MSFNIQEDRDEDTLKDLCKFLITNMLLFFPFKNNNNSNLIIFPNSL